MIHRQSGNTERRRVLALAPLIVLSNGFLLLCMLALGLAAVRGDRGLGVVTLPADANQQAVKDYLAAHLPGESYRIRGWFPVASRERPSRDSTRPRAEQGIAQGVKLAFYGSRGVRQIDAVYLVRNGRVVQSPAAQQYRPAPAP